MKQRPTQKQEAGRDRRIGIVRTKITVLALACALLAGCSIFGSQTQVTLPDGTTYRSSKNLTIEYTSTGAGEVPIKDGESVRVINRPSSTSIVLRADASSVNQANIEALSAAAGEAAAAAVRGSAK